MSKLKIYGVTPTRTMRVFWMATELGLDYEQLPIAPRDGSTKTPEFLAVNPNGCVPAISDGELNLWESLAINLYLAKKHVGALAPRDDAENGLALQWSFWAAGVVEPQAFAALKNRALAAESDRDAAAADQAEAALTAPLAVLDGALAGRDYLLGDRFTVADLNLASVLSWAKMAKVDMTGQDDVSAWLRRCLSRPAYLQVRGG